MKDKQEMNSIELLKYKKLKNILERQKDHIKNVNDLTAGDDPSLLFYILADKLDYLLEDEPEKCISEKGVMTRRKLNILIKKLGPLFLSNPQIIEKKSELTGDKNYTDEIILPEEPVIWTANHAFKDDTLATILAIKRHAYILFGSVPQFYNTFDGITAWINGVAMANRKVSSSKKASMNKCIKAMSRNIVWAGNVVPYLLNICTMIKVRIPLVALCNRFRRINPFFPIHKILLNCNTRRHGG